LKSNFSGAAHSLVAFVGAAIAETTLPTIFIVFMASFGTPAFLQRRQTTFFLSTAPQTSSPSCGYADPTLPILVGSQDELCREETFRRVTLGWPLRVATLTRRSSYQRGSFAF